MIKKTTPIDEKLLSPSDVRTMAALAKDREEGKTLMGDVRVRVKLTNAGDEVMLRRGLLSADKVRHYEANALVDSGAIRSVLPSYVVPHLGLAIVHTTRVTYAKDGAEDVEVTEVVGIDIHGRCTTEETLVLGSEVLIGQTALESLDLLVDCTNHRVVGNPAHPDQPIIKIKFLMRSEMPRVAVHL